MEYAGGGQLNKVQQDDILWVINVKYGVLYLIGRLHVENVVEGMSAAQHALGTDDELWEGRWYAIPKDGTVEKMAYIRIMHIAGDLRFESDRDRLTIIDGRLEYARQVQAMRQVSLESVSLLNEAWYGNRAIADLSEDFRDTAELMQDHLAYTEGDLRYVTRAERQRNRKLVLDAKEQFKRDNGGLFCEACGFDFLISYGISYIEAHHIKPLSQQTGVSQRETNDLALLCANCHRVIHGRTPAMTIEELKSLVDSRRGRH